VPRLAGDVVAIHRLEFPFPVNYLCYASWGACFAVGDARQVMDFTVLAAIAANLLILVAALALNTAVDISTDERHGEKSHLASAARRFGRHRVIRWAATETAIGLLLVGLVTARSGRPSIVAIAAVMIALHVLYNAEPVRLKRRGLIGVAAFCVSVIILPFLLSFWAVRPDVDPPCWPIVAGLGTLAMGRMTLWSVPDLTADAATGMRTPVVRYGPAGTLALSFAVMIAGLLLIGWGLWWRYGPVWALPLVALQGSFLYGSLALVRHGDDQNLLSSVRIRRRAMPPAMIGTVAMTIAPLIAR
jgi:4-hydroxybenzoate polyprenyltransferase